METAARYSERLRAELVPRRWHDARAALLPAAFVTILATNSGGYFPSTWGWSALGLLWVAALALLLQAETSLGRIELYLLGALTAFAGWTLLSGVWSSSLTQPVLESERALVYVAGLGAVLLVVDRASYRALLAGCWAAISVVCGYSLLTRLVPDRFGVVDLIAPNRLSEPLGYWNALGIFAAIGAMLALGLAARAQNLLLRALAAASTVVLLPTLYFTFSRGAWIAFAVGLLAAIALDPRRLQLTAVLLVVSPWPAAAVALSSQSSALTRLRPLASAAHDGHRLALVVVGLAIGAAVAAFVFGSIERRRKVGPGLRRAFAVVVLVAVAAGLAAIVFRFGSPPTIARNVYDGFVAQPPITSGPNERLFNLSGDNRVTQWRVAWADYEDHPWLGSGAGSYERYWLQHRPIGGKVRDAFSVYLETLAELGPVGVALLIAALGAPLVGAVRARGQGLVPIASGAYVAYLVHAGVDWDWEMTVVTLLALFIGAALVLAMGERERRFALSIRARAAGLSLAAVLAGLAVVALVGNGALSRASRTADLRKAESAARTAIRWAPWSAQPWQELGEIQLEQGRRTAARRSFQRAIGKDRQNWELWFDLAKASEGKARRKALARALSLNPLSPELSDWRVANAGRDSTQNELRPRGGG